MIVELYTDGACKKDKAGGWGCVLKYGDHKKEICGGELDTTNNRMEMLAVIMGLRALTRSCEQVHVTTDSQYVIGGATEWIGGWIRRGWKTAQGDPVKNADLWKEMRELMLEHVEVTWQWVKGHNGHPENERADQLANEGVLRARAKG